TGKRMDVESASTGNNAQIQLYESNSTDAQRFKIITTGNGDNAFKILTGSTGYSKCVTVKNSSFSPADVIQYTYDNGGNIDSDHWYLEDVTLNERQTVIAAAGEIKTYQITIPDNRNYVVETIQKQTTYDTELYVSNLTYGTLYDDDSGAGSYSQICFNGQAGRDIAVSVKFKNLSEGETAMCYLQIRKQQAVFYGFDYGSGDINTTSDLTTPYDQMSNYFRCLKFTDKNVSHFLGNDTRNYARGNSEILFFAGHGKGNNATGTTGVKFYDNTWLNYVDIPNLSNVRVAVWAACYSANKNNIYNSSMIEKSVAQGAKSSIGFTVSVNDVSARRFTNNLFKKLATGATVAESASYAANNLIWPFDNAKNYLIAGNSLETVTTALYIKNSLSTVLAPDDMDAIATTLANDKRYKSYKIKSGIRYYWLVNGFLSDHFIDIIYDGKGNIVDIYEKDEKIYKEKTDFEILPIIQNKSLQDSGKESYIVYINRERKFVPVLIQSIDYCCVDGSVCNEYKCVNLYDGTNINYEDICAEE
ncbi:MAG: RICIN domain-containing protein, partial [Clostridia bacterium]|nr:RICIN domain-containing protein [Clostridia bacterium]